MSAPRTVQIGEGTGAHDVVLCDDAPAESARRAAARGVAGCAVIADSNVAERYARPVAAALSASVGRAELLTFTAGEASKTRASWAALTDAMLARGLGRDTLVVGVGGGVTTDLAGFVAATYMRGVACLLVPTSLLAMVDAAIGGKTGVDTPAGKNLVGAFHPPAAVLVDVGALRTLPVPELREGLVEALKHGAIADADYFDVVCATDPRATASAAALRPLVERSVEIKADVVTADPLEAGPRAILNFGHTVGHALEAAAGFSGRHGTAVAAGMVAEAEIGEALGVTERGTADRLREALDALGVERAAVPDAHAAADAALRDKKNRAGAVRCVLLRRIGEVARAPDGGWTHAVPPELLRGALERVEWAGATPEKRRAREV